MSSIEQATLASRLLLELEVELGEVTSTGPMPTGELRLVAIAGGTFQGPELRGRVLPGGADWQSVRSDGTLEIRAHYLLETEQGERIEVRSEGLRAGPPDVLARLGRGELVPASEYYFRTAFRLATGSARLHHLNDLIAISIGERRARGVRLRVFQVL